MAHRVHPAVKEVEAPTLQSVPDRSPPQTELDQLRSGDHAVLARGEAGDVLVRVTFGPYDGLNCSRFVHGSDGAEEPVTCLLRYVPFLLGSSTSNWTSRP